MLVFRLKVTPMPRILVINPGSTSTKISVFDDMNCLFTESVFHDAPQLLSFPTANDQVPFRMKVVEDLLEKYDVPFESIDVYVGRGGCAYSQKAGVMEIDERLVRDTAEDKGGSDHPAKLGVMMAWELGRKYGKKMFTVNPTNVDELCDSARITGISGVYRRAQTHVLNQKAIAKKHAESLGLGYDSCSFIVCHIDGGITVTAHEKGRMIDSTEGAGGDGPFSPTRLGSIPVMELANYVEKHSPAELRTMCSRSGGLVSHFGTSDARIIHKMVEQGDPKACTIWNAMVYQICKSIGAMAAVLKGHVDAIILTGGLVRYEDICAQIKDRCSWIAPVALYPGEVEQEAMAQAVLDVLSGKEEAFRYSGEPVFKGFGWE
jgi:butyrate kinase